MGSNTLFSAENRWFVPLISELTIANLAHFGMLAILAVYLTDNLALSATHTAILLAIFSLGLRGGRIVFAPFIGAIAPHCLIPATLILSILGYLGLANTQAIFPVAGCLLLIGTGYGINSMLVTTLTSYTAQKSSHAFSMYAVMHTGVNIAAIIAPITCNWLRLHVSAQTPFYFSAGILGISLAVSRFIRSDIAHNYKEVRFRAAAGQLLRTRSYRMVLGFVAISWLIYTQKFAATPLFIDKVLERPGYIGLAIMLNAVIGLFVSLPASSFIHFYSIASRHVLAFSFLLYGAGYGILALFPSLNGLWAGLVCWSVGEALLMPQLNSLVAQYTELEQRFAGFSLAAIAIGIGEATGNGLGIILLSSSFSHGKLWLCYASFAFIACIAYVCTRCLDIMENEKLT